MNHEGTFALALRSKGHEERRKEERLAPRGKILGL
ncbi:hypothetical protein Anacy_5276 [Anabaena cylindrica PCC 7122]|uniref:Uncharacterized protein n=1 Tax=Anabaena cylindrica (strain ATCC 27899 / PCC 7122) TaxID=272123 RepID=K9ZPW8_ANACC|nr:hypothetical protein Anacy_5276 [Anabaena cylindrica PCC 7122]BAY02314.1 hypothetical protein NIES19_15570 [Anabaena cylindrica PCC 7122]